MSENKTKEELIEEYADDLSELADKAFGLLGQKPPPHIMQIMKATAKHAYSEGYDNGHEAGKEAKAQEVVELVEGKTDELADIFGRYEESDYTETTKMKQDAMSLVTDIKNHLTE